MTNQYKVFFFLGLVFLSVTTLQAKSFFNERQYRSYVSDNHATKAGDVLTVLIVENAKARGSAQLASNKSISLGAKANYNQQGFEANLGVNGKLDNAASTQRQGNIKATFSVQLMGLTKMNQWIVEGYQDIQINGELQSIRLHGLIRQEDISAQNTILSSQIANASIAYNGIGSVSESQRKGLFVGILSALGVV